eukprot:scaffold2998_cov390-Prasinococcus_capsulatus_cf.AAC.1
MKTVPVYGYFSGAKQDHMYGLSYEAPAGQPKDRLAGLRLCMLYRYVPQGYAFSLFSDGDFAGSTPLYSSRRVNNQGSPVGGINADTTVGVVPMQGSAGPSPTCAVHCSAASLTSRSNCLVYGCLTNVVRCVPQPIVPILSTVPLISSATATLAPQTSSTVRQSSPDTTVSPAWITRSCWVATLPT